MSARDPAGALPSLTGGVNRFNQEAAANQCVEALDVFEDRGELRRRDAFHAIATSAPFPLPAGRTHVVVLDEGGNGTVYQDRNPTMDVSEFAFGVLVGCEVPFDGIDWKHVENNITGPDANAHLQVQYWNGSAWTTIDEVVDTTSSFYDDGSGNLFLLPLLRDGRISWHRSLLTGWAAQTLAGLSRSMYYIRLNVLDGGSSGTAPAAAAMPGTGDIDLASPGPLAFLLEPVRSIIPARSKAGRSALLIGSDRRARRGSEPGAALGLHRSASRSTEVARLIADEGAGIFGQVAYPAISDAAPGEAWPSGTWNTTAASAGNEGTSGTLMKNRRDYSWIEQQFRGGVVAQVSPVAGTISQTTYNGTFAFAATGRNTLLRANQWEHFRIRCIAFADSGTPVDEEREVVGNLAYDSGTGRVTLTYYPEFSVAPSASNVFQILRPHHLVKLSGSERFLEIADVEASVAHGIELTPSTSLYAPASDLSNLHCHWSVVQELQWLLEAGRHWSACIDLTTRKLLMTNGSGILEWDGRQVRRNQAMADETSVRVQRWVGALPDQAREELNARALAGSKLERTPPRGRFLVDFRGRTVVGSLQGYPYDVQWSAPAPDNDIWPLAYRTQIRDSENNSISAIWVAQDVLFVATPTSIHAAFPPDENGFLVFQPAHRGTSFISQRSVCALPNGTVIGATADGVSIFDGRSMTTVLDEWERLLPQGVNEGKLCEAVGAVSFNDNLYFLAVTSTSDENDYVLVLDLESGKWWVWSAPWGGITEIARDFDELGGERMLFGTADGHVAVLRRADTDDGQTVTGYARSKSMQLDSKLETMAPIEIVMSAHETGASRTIDLRVYLNQNAQHNDAQGGDTQVNFLPDGTASAVFDDAAALFDGTSVLFGDERLSTMKRAIGAGSHCEHFAYEIRGTSQWVLRALALKTGRVGGHRSHG